MIDQPTAARFWNKTDIGNEDECWLWLGSRNKKGYGQFRVHSHPASPRRASRVAWEIANGSSAPAGLMVCHRCDNPPCVNPSHLFLGTAKENMEDCAQKGRSVRGRSLPGRPCALTGDQIAEARQRIARGETLRSVAKQYGVAHTTVMRLLNRVDQDQ